MQLCDTSGARCGFFDDLLTHIHCFHKKKVDITKAKGKFVKAMQTKVKCSRPMSRKVGGRDVIYFLFFDSLQDILRSTVFYDVHNLCVNGEEQDCFSHFQPATVDDYSGIMSNQWACNTQDSITDFDPDLDFFLGYMIYSDKNCTDVNQHYPLEPWMFTLILLW
jgi:hypothetical protein